MYDILSCFSSYSPASGTLVKYRRSYASCLFYLDNHPFMFYCFDLRPSFHTTMNNMKCDENQPSSEELSCPSTTSVLFRTTSNGAAASGSSVAKRPVASPRYGHTGDHEVRLPVESSASAVSTAQFPHSVGGDHLLLDELQTRHRSYQRPIAAERKSLTSTSSTHSFPLQEHPSAYSASASPDCHVDAPQGPAILAILLQLQEQMKATQEEMKALQSNQQSTVPRSSADVAEASRSSEIDLLRAENARLRNEALMRDLDVGPSLRDRSKNIPKVDIHDLQSSFATFLDHCKFLRLTSDADILDAALGALPKTVISSFFGEYRENASVANLKKYIFESCQVTYPCHRIPSLRSSVKTHFDAITAVNKILSCPQEELRKFIYAEVTPDHVRENVKQLTHLPWNDFVRRATHVLSTANSAPHRNHVARFNTASSYSNARSNPSNARGHGDQARYVCRNHQRYGVNAFSCEGPRCAMHTTVLPRPRNSGNDVQRD